MNLRFWQRTKVTIKTNEEITPQLVTESVKTHITPVYDETSIKTLEWINNFRKERGFPSLDELPQGRTGKSDGCVMQVAVRDLFPNKKVRVGGGVIAVRGDGGGVEESFKLSSDARRFITNFDNHCYPHLEKLV